MDVAVDKRCEVNYKNKKKTVVYLANVQCRGSELEFHLFGIQCSCHVALLPI